MAGNCFLMTGYSNESDGTIDYVMGVDGTWLPVGTDPTLINAAAAYLDAAFPIEQVRGIQGDFQRKYTDRDVRMERATVTIVFPAV
jgi:hypothetical protein